MLFTKVSESGSINPRLKELIERGLKLDDGTVTGKFELDGSKITVTFSNDNLEPASMRRLEVHAAFADIQIVLQGTEKYGYLAGTSLKHVEDRLEKDDVAFADIKEQCSYRDLRAGDAVVFLPGEYHKPLCATDECACVRKAIFKVSKDLISGYLA